VPFDDLPRCPRLAHPYYEADTEDVEVDSAAFGRVGVRVVSYGRRDAPPLLLVHGLMTSSYSWRYLLEPLADRFRMIAPDLSGSGRSDRLPVRAHSPRALLLFVILFGLSMDYHVFILSRIREAVAGGMSTDEAVAHGIKQTAGVVTSAAIVMVAVFSIFATLSSLEFKQMGVGLAVAILIDATIVRAVLLPATMKLLGDWNWYLPKRLSWLPSVRHESAPEPARA